MKVNMPEVQETEKSDDNKRKHAVIILIVTGIIILLLFLLKSCGTDDNNQNINPVIPQGEDYDGYQNAKQIDTGLIEIPVYEHLYVSVTDPYIWLNNPDSNAGTAYFRYMVKEGDKILFGEREEEQIWIDAGKAVRADMSRCLSPGDHDITICIMTCDPETGEALNGAEVEAQITMQGIPENVVYRE